MAMLSNTNMTTEFFQVAIYEERYVNEIFFNKELIIYFGLLILFSIFMNLENENRKLHQQNIELRKKINDLKNEEDIEKTILNKKCKVADLKAICKERKIKYTGMKKDEMITKIFYEEKIIDDEDKNYHQDGNGLRR